MNILTYFKKKIPTNNKSNAKNECPANLTPLTTHFNHKVAETAFDLLEEKFIRIDILIEKNKLILQDTFEKDLNTNNVEEKINDGLNKSRQILLDKLLKHRTRLLSKLDASFCSKKLIKFTKNNKPPLSCDYIFSTYFNTGHSMDLLTKIKYLQLFSRVHEVNVKKNLDYFNSWYGELEILVLDENRLLYYYKSHNLLQITDFKRKVISKIYLSFETLNDVFDFVSFKANCANIVCLKHNYNRTLIIVFDMELNELKRILVNYKGDFCLINKREILLKEINSNKYHLYDYDLEEKHFESKMFDRDESIIKLTDDSIYSFSSFKGMNIVVLTLRNFDENRVKLSLFLKQPINRNQIKINLKQNKIIVLDKDQIKLFNMNGSLLFESARDKHLKSCDSIELVNDDDSEENACINKYASIYLINRYKNAFYLI